MMKKQDYSKNKMGYEDYTLLFLYMHHEQRKMVKHERLGEEYSHQYDATGEVLQVFSRNSIKMD